MRLDPPSVAVLPLIAISGGPGDIAYVSGTHNGITGRIAWMHTDTEPDVRTAVRSGDDQIHPLRVSAAVCVRVESAVLRVGPSDDRVGTPREGCVWVSCAMYILAPAPVAAVDVPMVLLAVVDHPDILPSG